MIIIIDDTFVERHKYNDVGYLEQNKFKAICQIFSMLKIADLSNFVNILPQCDLFCNHRSLQLYNNANEPLNVEENTKLRENLLNKVKQKQISQIEFSRGLETNFEAKKIDKDLFYTNLKPFLDYYLINKEIETKILFFGENFQEIENLTSLEILMSKIRELEIDGYENDEIISAELSKIYGQQNVPQTILSWKNRQYTKKEIIKEINNKSSM